MSGVRGAMGGTVRILWAVSLWALLADTESALAQAPAALPAARATHPAHRGWTSEDRLRRLTQLLDLSAPQQSQVKDLLELRQQQAVKLQALDSVSAVDRVHRLQALDRRTVEQIKRVLTPAQLRLYDPHPDDPHPAAAP